MLQFMQPLFAAVIGSVLCVFGLIHSVTLVPPAAVWQSVAMVTPDLMTVTVFIGCLLVAAAGIAMLVGGLGAVRRRFGQLRRVRWDTEPNYDPRDDGWR